MSTQPQGLYRKFNVSRTDGRDQPGGDRVGAEYFVCDLTYDKFSRAALLAYAGVCKHEYPDLSRDLIDRAFAPVAVVRDENGLFCHPVTNACNEDEYADAADWLGQYGFECSIVEFESDAPGNVADRYFDTGEGCAEWAPTPPDGDGWYLLAIYDGDDGPGALFIRKAMEVNA